uniref:MSP domain-containing protein n=1 Tax=Steinernema glaseri TaxID=37863 RepID=A0A1I8AL66_9BILA
MFPRINIKNRACASNVIVDKVAFRKFTLATTISDSEDGLTKLVFIDSSAEAKTAWRRKAILPGTSWWR